MKKAVSIALVVCVIAVVAILAFGLGAKNNPAPTATPGESVATSSVKTYTAAEVAKHALATDCWLVIGGKVYDVTKFLAEKKHPAGSEAITPFCGKDATVAFETRGKKSPEPHPQNARNILDSFLLGPLAL